MRAQLRGDYSRSDKKQTYSNNSREKEKKNMNIHNMFAKSDKILHVRNIPPSTVNRRRPLDRTLNKNGEMRSRVHWQGNNVDNYWRLNQHRRKDSGYERISPLFVFDRQKRKQEKNNLNWHQRRCKISTSAININRYHSMHARIFRSPIIATSSLGLLCIVNAYL